MLPSSGVTLEPSSMVRNTGETLHFSKLGPVGNSPNSPSQGSCSPKLILIYLLFWQFSFSLGMTELGVGSLGAGSVSKLGWIWGGWGGCHVSQLFFKLVSCSIVWPHIPYS